MQISGGQLGRPKQPKQEPKARGIRVQDQLGYIVRLCLRVRRWGNRSVSKVLTTRASPEPTFKKWGVVFTISALGRQRGRKITGQPV